MPFIQKILQLRDEEHYDLYTGAMQRAEVVFFMKPEEKKDTMLFLSQIKTRSVDQEIVDSDGKWMNSIYK